MSETEKPLVTFALFAYNQEKYIREAVEGAFAQTYSPLQIILSDDCSPDSTFEIMEKMVAGYSGLHEILLNHNKQNLGLAGHINHVMSLAKGELIVVAAGDDISLPERTEKLIAFYLSKNKPLLLFSDVEEIDNDGNSFCGESITQAEQSISEFIQRPRIRGATCAWDKQIFTHFSKLNTEVVAEDMVLPVRAYLLGRPPKMLDEKLVKYRRDEQRNKGSVIMAVKFFWQMWPQFSSSKQHLNDVQNLDLTGTDYLSVIEINATRKKYNIDFVQSQINIAFIKTTWNCLKLFGAKWLCKLFIIKFGNLSAKEKNMLRFVSADQKYE